MGKNNGWVQLTKDRYTIGDSNWRHICDFDTKKYFIGMIVFTIDNGTHKFLQLIPLETHSISYTLFSNYAVYEDIEIKITGGKVYARTISNTFHHDNLVESVWGVKL